jgi:hypothetical protein
MKYFLVILLLFLGVTTYASRHKSRGLPRTEVGLMNNVLGCLSHKDSGSYFDLFIPFDTLWRLVIYNEDRSPQAIKELNHLKESPQALLEFDPYYNHHIMERFAYVLTKGEDSGIHWNEIVMQRYELSKMQPNRTLMGYDRIAPERFKGYLFVRDMLGRLTFCITVTEIQKINGFFFGGQVLNILEASSIDEYMTREVEEQKYFDWLSKNNRKDSLRNDSIKNGLIDSTLIAADTPAAPKKPNFLNVNATEEDTFKARREVVDRRYYEGKFDEEIPVRLKDRRTGKISAYDGLYKFGDQVSYVKLHVTRSNEGKWLMEDDLPLGTLELELKNKVYTGSWTNNENQTGYDVVLTQTDISSKKLQQLETMLETGITGSINEPNAPQKKVVPAEDKENDADDEPGSKAKSKKQGEDNPKEKEKPEKKPKPKRNYDDD